MFHSNLGKITQDYSDMAIGKHYSIRCAKRTFAQDPFPTQLTSPFVGILGVSYKTVIFGACTLNSA